MRDFAFQSTPPVRGATALSKSLLDLLPISIHAPREGGDDYSLCVQMPERISIHAPREGGDTPRR